MGYSGLDVFKQMDKNGSGNINFGEFKDGIARTTGQNAPDPVLRAVFSLLDSDGTGGISYEEILKLLGEENTGLRSAVEAVAGLPETPPPPMPPNQPATLVVDENFEQGEPIRIGFVASGGEERSWVGIYDSGAKNSDYVDWLYLNGSQEQNYDSIPAGSLTFELELDPGAYDIRLFGDGGYETLLAETSFAIIEPEPEPEPEPGGPPRLHGGGPPVALRAARRDLGRSHQGGRRGRRGRRRRISGDFDEVTPRFWI